MNCCHDGYRSITTCYDRSRAVLVYYWSCDQCGVTLDEAARQDYRPQFVRRPREHQPLPAPTLAR